MSTAVIYNKCCKGGRISLPPFLPRPEPLQSLARFNGGSTSNKFMKSIHQYNCLFSFTSMGANIDRSINDGGGPSVFKISGQVHHRIGSMLPRGNTTPKFIQLYIYDTTNEVKNQIASVSHEDARGSDLDPAIVQSLQSMLDAHNPLAQKFRMAQDRLEHNADDEFVIRILAPKEGEPPQYSLPSVEELALLVVGEFSPDAFERDIVIQKKAGPLVQISALHPAFMALQYPLLFPYAERGFETGVLYAGEVPTTDGTRNKMTMQDYYCYNFHYRKDKPNPFLCYGALSSQAKVDARACVDENRLRYIIEKQADIRMESIQGICDAVGRGLTEGSEMGKMTVLPASYIGGRRYMMQNYHDGIAICRQFGPPDFFITFTCNPKWLEISEGIFELGQKPRDRNDLIVRVFNLKLEELLHDLKQGKPFGRCKAALHTVEFQKRGLPHAHIIIWTCTDTSNPTPAMIDRYISTEIPDPKVDPLGYALVAEHMVHGPCGTLNPKCPCMKKQKCSKFFPKSYQAHTTTNTDGFAVYKRPENDLFVVKNGVQLDNRWVVPYNMDLLKKYQAHINVEWCNKTSFIKYLFKYVTKGADYSKVYLQRVRNGEAAPFDEETNTCNEVKEYLRCRYICEQDAIWCKTQQGKIGRLRYVHPSAGERYYLRMLLLTVRGATSFEHMRFHNGIWHNTFKEACTSRGFLGNDQEWYNAFDEAIAWASSAQLRDLFVTMVIFCEVSDEYALFEKVWPHLVDDIKKQYRQNVGDPMCELSESRLRDSLLDELASLFAQNGQDISKLNLPPKTHANYPSLYNRLVEEELSYPIDSTIDMECPTSSLNEDQTKAFNVIVERVNNKMPGFFFVSGYGGTGKTYLWNHLVNYLRARKKIVLTVASSGVAALLLPGGRTAHSRFKIPCDPEDDTVCDVSRGTMLAELIDLTDLVIWDEAFMTDKKALEALDRTFRDITKMNNAASANIPFGGKIVVLGGDLRQILPVVEGGGKEEILNATIVRSYLWADIEILSLTQNMRITCSSHDPYQQAEVAAFSRWVLDIGEGKVEGSHTDGDTDQSLITMPDDLLLLHGKDKLAALVDCIYPNLDCCHKDTLYLAERAILTPTNDLTDCVNDYMVSLVPGDDKEYISADTIAQSTGQHESFEQLYPVEYLHSVTGNNFPHHRLILKQGIPIMLLRNLNQTASLCNGTRLIVTSLGEWTIEAKIMSGRHANKKFTIPRIKLCMENKKLPFTLERRQFPVRVCYGMTINKSQGQTLSSVGLYLKTPVFTHGQLYVVVSRVTTRRGLKIYIEDDEGRPTNQTKNVVYSEILKCLP